MSIHNVYKRMKKLLEKEIDFELSNLSKVTKDQLRAAGVNKQTLINMRADYAKRFPDCEAEAISRMVLMSLERMALLKRQKLALDSLKHEIELIESGFEDDASEIKGFVLGKVKANIFLSPEEVAIICPNLSVDTQYRLRREAKWSRDPIPAGKRKDGKTIVYKPSELLQWCERVHPKENDEI